MKNIFVAFVLMITLGFATPAKAQFFYDYGCNCDYAYNHGYYDGASFGYGAPFYGGYGGFGRGGYFGGFGGYAPVYGGFYGQSWGQPRYGGTGSLWGDVALGVTGALLGGGVYGNPYYPYYGF